MRRSRWNRELLRRVEFQLLLLLFQPSLAGRTVLLAAAIAAGVVHAPPGHEAFARTQGVVQGLRPGAFRAVEQRRPLFGRQLSELACFATGVAGLPAFVADYKVTTFGGAFS